MLKQITHITEAARVKTTKAEHHNYNQSLILVKYVLSCTKHYVRPFTCITSFNSQKPNRGLETTR